MKWDATEPSRGSFNFGTADQTAKFAKDNGRLAHRFHPRLIAHEGLNCPVLHVPAFPLNDPSDRVDMEAQDRLGLSVSHWLNGSHHRLQDALSKVEETSGVGMGTKYELSIGLESGR